MARTSVDALPTRTPARSPGRWDYKRPFVVQSSGCPRPRRPRTQRAPTLLSLQKTLARRRGIPHFPARFPPGAVSSVVEHYLDTVGVAGSNPASRTIQTPETWGDFAGEREGIERRRSRQTKISGFHSLSPEPVLENSLPQFPALRGNDSGSDLPRPIGHRRSESPGSEGRHSELQERGQQRQTIPPAANRAPPRATNSPHPVRFVEEGDPSQRIGSYHREERHCEPMRPRGCAPKPS